MSEVHDQTTRVQVSACRLDQITYIKTYSKEILFHLFDRCFIPQPALGPKARGILAKDRGIAVGNPAVNANDCLSRVSF